MELICAVKTYQWGKKGGSSLVAQFASANSGMVPDDETPYAEFWMGTHPNGPSLLKTSKTELSEHISHNPKSLGYEAVKDFGIQLPFLMKILSVEKPLSIQVHPTKSQAEDMNKKFPEIYKDNNHKPEMVFALSKCELLCAFQPWPCIKNYLEIIPELQVLIDSKALKKFCETDKKTKYYNELLQACFQDFIKSDEKIVASTIEKLLERSKSLSPDDKEKQLIPLVEKLNGFFPNDIGVLCVYFLQHIVLEPGKSLYVTPGMPHAYLSGEFLECMANSDNVVRAGLTPKFRDVEMLTKITAYQAYEYCMLEIAGRYESSFCKVYPAAVKDFAVAKIEVPKNEKYLLGKRESASILCIVKGKGKMDSMDLDFGKVFFIPAESEYYIESKNDLLMFQGFCNENRWLK